MDVHAAEAWQIESGARQDETVGHDDQDIRQPTRELRPVRLRLQCHGLGNRYTALQGRQLYRACGQLAPAALGPIRLREYAHELVARTGQSMKRGQREIRRSSERNAQSAHVGNNYCGAQYV
jgi:hypothetical protein